MPRFVILEHDHPTLHWDFMLEADGVLRTWRLPNRPVVGDEMIAEEIGDHRLAYLDYEGPVSGGRGAVKRWEFGTYEVLTQSNDSWELNIVGEKGTIRVRMTRIKGSQSWWWQAY